MLVPIQIDTTELSQEFSLTQKDVAVLTDAIAKDVAAMIISNWDAQARTNLGSTREIYRRGLVVEKGSQGVAYAVLTGKLPNMIEKGAEAFDMKEGFSKSDKVKFNKKGQWYLTIPFRWATPGAIAENEVFSSVMPTEVYKEVKNSLPNKTSVGGSFQVGRGLSASQLTGDNAVAGKRAAFSDRFTKRTFDVYAHKKPIFEGIRREEKTYEKATQGQYFSFRRVGMNSDSNSWIHRGFSPRNFAEKAVNDTNIDYIVERTVDEFLSNL